jgi:ligand-binding SRPBCC domain-containing protein
MPVYTLKSKQRLPIPLEEAWEFFSSPLNLRHITPAYMDFRVTADPEFLDKIYPGQIITYTVKPLFGIPLFWMTEITQVQNHQFFVDEQRQGPYALWHHQHHFKSVPGGVEMTDLVHYKPPFGILGRIANWLFIRRQLQSVFDYRSQILESKFGVLK